MQQSVASLLSSRSNAAARAGAGVGRSCNHLQFVQSLKWAWIGPALLVRRVDAADESGADAQGFTFRSVLRERAIAAEVGQWRSLLVDYLVDRDIRVRKNDRLSCNTCLKFKSLPFTGWTFSPLPTTSCFSK